MRPLASWRLVSVGGALSMLIGGWAASAQRPSTGASRSMERRVARDTIVVANGRYDASHLHRLFMGDNYRDLWELPITVPVLDLAHFAGGLQPTEEGGGNQTRSLRFDGADGRTWTFRPLKKDKLSVIGPFEGTVIMDLVSDGLSGSFPGAPVVATPFLKAVGIPHPEPTIVIMPDDARLGKFRHAFARRLGTIEQHVDDSDKGRGFASAIEVIDSDHLLKRLNAEPRRHVDARMLLRARLIDFLLSDTDRHRDQWKWGRMREGDSLLTPIPRDRDQVLATHDGLLLNAARKVKPYLVVFDSTYPKIATMVGYARDLDDRLLAELDRTAWDSVARDVRRAITDSVIHAGLSALPPEYHPHLGVIEKKLRSRRDHLPDAAADYYGTLALVVSVHATDSADRARVQRSADGSVEVQIGRPGAPWYSRRFLPSETKEIRLYLHGGNDTASVTGSPGDGIIVRVVGGGGENVLVDSITTSQNGGVTRLYDAGRTPPERYEPDSAFNRLPWQRALGTLIPPGRDWGEKTSPIAALGSGRGLGAVPRLGVKRYTYGFRRVPYKSMTLLQAEYATATEGYRVLGEADFRLEDSRLHLGGQAEVSEFEVVNYYGLGNDVAYSRDPYFNVDLRQWSVRPIVAYAFGRNRDATIGPVLKYSTTALAPGRFISDNRPYGASDFGQLGLELSVKHDTRDDASNPRHGVYVQGAASTWPAVWSVRSSYHRVGVAASAYLPLPGPRKPVLALRAGGEKLLGSFPYFDAAFVGGSRTLRSVHYRRLAGDASAYGAAEVRLPVAHFPLILPWDVGLLGFAEAGRVFVDGASPGGWHRAVGGGLWIGVLGPATSITVLFTNARERGIILGTGMSF